MTKEALKDEPQAVVRSALADPDAAGVVTPPPRPIYKRWKTPKPSMPAPDAVRPAPGVALVGTVGIPARYGGFETLIEHIGPGLAAAGCPVLVSCDATMYWDRPRSHGGCRLLWIPIRANGRLSSLHDAVAVVGALMAGHRIILMLGVSGAWIVPFIRLFTRAKVVVHVDGIEWRRPKWGRWARRWLKLLDAIGRRYADRVIVDNQALIPLIPETRPKIVNIAYGGDHIGHFEQAPWTRADLCNGADGERHILTIARIEPENNIELLAEASEAAALMPHLIVGNWDSSAYARQLRRNLAGHRWVKTVDSTYDMAELARLRRGCAIYVHGHSVGGTNPALVEALFAPGLLLAYDCPFNRLTADDAAAYFHGANQLAEQIRTLECSSDYLATKERVAQRYAWNAVIRQYRTLLDSLGEEH